MGQAHHRNINSQFNGGPWIEFVAVAIGEEAGTMKK